MIQYRDWFVDNPVLRYHLWGRTRWVLRHPTWHVRVIAYTGLAVYLWSYFVALNHGGLEYVLGLEMVVMFLAAIPLTHALMAMEFEKGTWDALVLTRLSAGQIVMGKFLSRFALLMIVLLLFQPVVLLSSATSFLGLPDYLLYPYLVKGQLVIFGWTTFLITLTLWLSYRLRRGMTTAAAAFFMQIFLLGILPALYAALVSVMGFHFLDTDPFHQKGWWSSWGWMIDPRYLAIVYNPVFTTIEFWNETASPSLPHLWGLWQGFVYILLSSMIVARLARSVARGAKKKA